MPPLAPDPGRLERELADHPPIGLGNARTLADVELAVCVLLADSPRRLRGAL